MKVLLKFLLSFALTMGAYGIAEAHSKVQCHIYVGENSDDVVVASFTCKKDLFTRNADIWVEDSVLKLMWYHYGSKTCSKTTKIDPMFFVPEVSDVFWYCVGRGAAYGAFHFGAHISGPFLDWD